MGNKQKFLNFIIFKFLLSISLGAFVLFGSFNPALAGQVSINDPGFSQDSRDIDKQWGLLRVGFLQAWEKTTGSFDNLAVITHFFNGWTNLHDYKYDSYLSRYTIRPFLSS